MVKHVAVVSAVVSVVACQNKSVCTPAASSQPSVEVTPQPTPAVATADTQRVAPPKDVSTQIPLHTRTVPLDAGPPSTARLGELRAAITEASERATAKCKLPAGNDELNGVVHIGFIPAVDYPAVSFSPGLQESLMYNQLFDCVRREFKALSAPVDHKPIFLKKNIGIAADVPPGRR